MLYPVWVPCCSHRARELIAVPSTTSRTGGQGGRGQPPDPALLLALVCFRAQGSNLRSRGHSRAGPSLPPRRQGAEPGAVPCSDWSLVCGKALCAGDPHVVVGDSHVAECLGGSAELQAIKARVQEMEKEAEWMRELQLEVESSLAGNLEAGLFSKEIRNKTEVDQRSIYVSNVDYEATAEELESFFRCCGKINRVTILCNRFSGRPKGYAYIEFEEQSSVKAAMALNKSLFRGRVIKVLPKRTNVPGISTTSHGGYQGHFRAYKGLAQWGSYYGKQYKSV